MQPLRELHSRPAGPAGSAAVTGCPLWEWWLHNSAPAGSPAALRLQRRPRHWGHAATGLPGTAAVQAWPAGAPLQQQPARFCLPPGAGAPPHPGRAAGQAAVRRQGEAGSAAQPVQAAAGPAGPASSLEGPSGCAHALGQQQQPAEELLPQRAGSTAEPHGPAGRTQASVHAAESSHKVCTPAGTCRDGMTQEQCSQ